MLTSVGAEFASGLALGGGQERHDGQRQDGDDNAGDRAVGLAGADQGADRAEGDVRSEREERHRDDPRGGLLPRFADRVVAGGELPADRSGGEDLDDGVQAEADRRVEEAIVPAVIATIASITL